jgi:hypothetical protein
MDVLRAQTARRSLIAGRVSLALYKKGPTLSRVCGSPRGRAEVMPQFVSDRGVRAGYFPDSGNSLPHLLSACAHSDLFLGVRKYNARVDYSLISGCFLTSAGSRSQFRPRSIPVRRCPAYFRASAVAHLHDNGASPFALVLHCRDKCQFADALRQILNCNLIMRTGKPGHA